MNVQLSSRSVKYFWAARQLKLPFRTLIGNVPGPLLHLRIAMALQQQLLRPHRVVDDLVKDLGHGMCVQAQLAPVGDQPAQELLLPMRIAQLQIFAFFEFHDAGDQLAAARQQIQHLIVDRVNTLAKLLEIHGFPIPHSRDDWPLGATGSASAAVSQTQLW